ncbi:MAG: hypothetical protein DMF82_19910 [Acidobacteria bacterium]|nr:MAG: hypothetical protein DMF82_19910 [Acidobacteriota bacterium]
MKVEKIRELSPDELRGKERELQEQLFRLRFQKSIGQLDDAGKIRDTRRDIARVKTIIRQHRLRFQKSIGQLDDAGKIRDTRRDIARVKTIIRQHDIERARTQGAEAKR